MTSPHLPTRTLARLRRAALFRAALRSVARVAFGAAAAFGVALATRSRAVEVGAALAAVAWAALELILFCRSIPSVASCARRLELRFPDASGAVVGAVELLSGNATSRYRAEIVARARLFFERVLLESTRSELDAILLDRAARGRVAVVSARLAACGALAAVWGFALVNLERERDEEPRAVALEEPRAVSRRDEESKLAFSPPAVVVSREDGADAEDVWRAFDALREELSRAVALARSTEEAASVGEVEAASRAFGVLRSSLASVAERLRDATAGFADAASREASPGRLTAYNATRGVLSERSRRGFADAAAFARAERGLLASLRSATSEGRSSSLAEARAASRALSTELTSFSSTLATLSHFRELVEESESLASAFASTSRASAALTVERAGFRIGIDEGDEEAPKRFVAEVESLEARATDFARRCEEIAAEFDAAPEILVVAERLDDLSRRVGADVFAATATTLTARLQRIATLAREERWGMATTEAERLRAVARDDARNDATSCARLVARTVLSDFEPRSPEEEAERVVAASRASKDATDKDATLNADASNVESDRAEDSETSVGSDVVDALAALASPSNATQEINARNDATGESGGVEPDAEFAGGGSESDRGVALSASSRAFNAELPDDDRARRDGARAWRPDASELRKSEKFHRKIRREQEKELRSNYNTQ